MEVESLKQRLVEEGQDYNTIDAFRLMDSDGNGQVTKQEIQDFIRSNFGGADPDLNDPIKLDLFIMRFDKNSKDKIKYSEFCTAFAPNNARS